MHVALTDVHQLAGHRDGATIDRREDGFGRTADSYQQQGAEYRIEQPSAPSVQIAPELANSPRKDHE
jgi:hypothetical protein